MAGTSRIMMMMMLMIRGQLPRQRRLGAFCLLAFVTACRTVWDVTTTTTANYQHLYYGNAPSDPELHHRRQRHESSREGTYLPRDTGGEPKKPVTRAAVPPFPWLTERDVDLGMDSYSAAWYMSRPAFLEVKVSDVKSLEGACFAVYRDRDHLVRMSLDYLDYAVEHGSQWWKALGCPHDPVAVNVTTSTYRAYVRKYLHNQKRTNATELPSSILRPTIALVAFSQLRADPQEPETSTHLDPDEAKVRHRHITVHSLAATLASLIRLGFGRILVVGHAVDDDVVVAEAFRFLDDERVKGRVIDTRDGPQATVRGSDLAFVRPTPEMMRVTEGGTGDDVPENVPRGALAGLQHAMLGHDARWTRQWLGESKTARDWKYVYYTEQDSVLHTRGSAVPHLRRALDDGLIVIPHRLQPVPHQLDVPTSIDGYDSFLSINFTVPQLLGPNDHCCDAQERRVYHPNVDGHEPCGAPWWLCGFSNSNNQWGNHSRLSRYGLIRLEDGTGVAAIAGSSHGRRCLVSRHPCKYREDSLRAATSSE